MVYTLLTIYTLAVGVGRWAKLTIILRVIKTSLHSDLFL